MIKSSVLCCVVCLYLANSVLNAFPVGFSYTKFSGPVSGPEKQILIYDDHDNGYRHVDYVANPDYQFSYGIEDPKNNVQLSRKEIRYGDTVHGEYSLVQPDGNLRIVKYRADDTNGFQAEVVTDRNTQSYGHHHLPEVIPVHEIAVDDELAVQKIQPAHKEMHIIHEEPSEQSEEQTDSADATEYSAEDQGQSEYKNAEDSESGSNESENSSY